MRRCSAVNTRRSSTAISRLLRVAIDDPEAVPNGAMPDLIGSCLVYAVYHSPRAFIRQLLELGADPNTPVDDRFPPLIAALIGTRGGRGVMPRVDVDDVVRLLLSFGADPNQRGVNDYTPLHTAVAEWNPLVVRLLLDSDAEPWLRTPIDLCETPLEMAEAAGLTDIAAMFARVGPPVRQRLRPGWCCSPTCEAPARSWQAHKPTAFGCACGCTRARQSAGPRPGDRSARPGSRMTARRSSRRSASSGGPHRRSLPRRGGHARRGNAAAGHSAASGVRTQRRAGGHPRRCALDRGMTILDAPWPQ